MRKQKIASESSHGDRTPFKDLTNKGANENLGVKRGSGTSWYGRLSAEQKEEHLQKQQKKMQIKVNVMDQVKLQIKVINIHSHAYVRSFFSYHMVHVSLSIFCNLSGENTPFKDWADKCKENREQQQHITSLNQGNLEEPKQIAIVCLSSSLFHI